MADIQLSFLLLGVFILLSHVTKGVHGQCSTPPVNQVVYEDSENVSMTCNSPTEVSWSIFPTNDDLFAKKITNYNDSVVPSLTDLYSVDQTNLLIKTAQSYPGTANISTSGYYLASGANRTAAKLVVVRGPPSCNCTAINATNNNVYCSITYADGLQNPIYAKITWTADGQFTKNDTIVRGTRVSGAYTSTSTLTIDASDTQNYECRVTFTRPMQVSTPYFATNNPVFYADCTPNNSCGTTTTSDPHTTTLTSSTECDCTHTTTCPPPGQNCTKASECGLDGTNMAAILDECVVKAELYARCDKCCAEDFVCGVVVTLRNDSRWLIHDSLCGDNSCQMVAVDASCMSSDWKLLTERRIITAGVRDFVNAGDSAGSVSGESDCSHSCKTMMDLL